MTKKSHESNVRKRQKQSSELTKLKYDYSKDYADKSWPYHHGKLDTVAKIVLIIFPIFMVSLIAYFYRLGYVKNQIRTPLDKPLMSSDGDMSLFWGTYRPNLYFGMKTRSPNSPVVGLMWLPQFSVGQKDSLPLRHWCDQNDKLPMYSWFNHDGSNFGFQEIYDTYYTVSTTFAKRQGGHNGGDWTARFTVTPRPGFEEAVVSIFFYVALDGDGNITADINTNNKRLNSISGTSTALGNFHLSFSNSESPVLKYNHYVSFADSLHNLKENLMSGFVQSYIDKERKKPYVASRGTKLPPDTPLDRANFMVHQVTFKIPFTLEVVFESESAATERTERLSGPVYENHLNTLVGNFSEKFESAFGLSSKGFDNDKIGFAKAALSNLLGGVGYFYGSSLVRSRHMSPDEVMDYWPAPLYTAVPSRSFFPRGFLWDEGFHNLLIQKWDQHISMEIIAHWLDLINAEGWIPREQILGSEARARVPSEFIVQHNENANPPTLFLPLQSIVRRLIERGKPSDMAYLRALFPRLQTWYNWFNTTQSGPLPSTYRWRGRDPNEKRELNPKTLTSGLDDYPRASHPTDDEYHVDLRCWMALASGVMADVARALNEPWEAYAATRDWLSDNRLLDELHWSRRTQRYADYGLHTDSVKLERPPPPPQKPGQRPLPPPEKERVSKEKPTLRHVDNMFGYISLFPFLTMLVQPDSIKLGKILSDIKDPNLLWTDYGLRSLAKKSPMYKKHNTEHDPPYWRGNIWINMNYLTLGALHHYSSTDGPYQSIAQEVYQGLRTNLINNMFNQFKATGYIWENYDDVTGNGQGCHPFTGWSALIVAIMAEEY